MARWRKPIGFVLGLAAAAAATSAAAGCELKQFGELPVEPDHRVVYVKGAVNGVPTQMIADTGSAMTLMWRDRAEALKVKLGNALGVDIYGVGGRAPVQLAYLDSLSLGDHTVRNFRVYVIGSPSFGREASMILGSDFFSQADVEFDLPDNTIRLIRDKGCTGPQMVYWNKPYSQVSYRGGNTEITSMYVTVMLNGQPVEAELDSGASVTIIDSNLAARLGAIPDAEPPRPEQAGKGIGFKSLTSHPVLFATFTLGDETIKNAKLRAGPLFNAVHVDQTGSRLGARETAGELPRMLLGADFLRAHRLMISPTHQMMYFSYMGGPVFDITSEPNRGQAAAPATPAAPSY